MAEPEGMACHGCSTWCVPERLEARPDPQRPGTWRIVEVSGPAEAPHVVQHAPRICCQRHAERVAHVLRTQRTRTRTATLLAMARVYDLACEVLDDPGEADEPVALTG